MSSSRSTSATMPWCGASRGTIRPRSATSAKVTGIAAGRSSSAAASRVAQIRTISRSGLASAAATACRPQKRGRFSALVAWRALRRIALPWRARPSLARRRPAGVDSNSPFRHGVALPISGPAGQVAEWLKAADCKSARVSRTLVRIQPCPPGVFRSSGRSQAGRRQAAERDLSQSPPQASAHAKRARRWSTLRRTLLNRALFVGGTFVPIRACRTLVTKRLIEQDQLVPFWMVVRSAASRPSRFTVRPRSVAGFTARSWIRQRLAGSGERRRGCDHRFTPPPSPGRNSRPPSLV